MTKPDNDVLYSHILLSDLQENHTLLPDESLRFVLLFYTLSSWQQQDQKTEGHVVSPFLKIPRRDHVLHPGKGTQQRQANVDAFKTKRAELLNLYGARLSDAQKELLSSNNDDCLPKFSTSFLMYKDQPVLNIHYRGGQDMYKESIFTNRGDPLYDKITELKNGYKQLQGMKAKRAMLLKEIETVQKKQEKLTIAWFVISRQHKLRLLQRPLAELGKQLSSLEKSQLELMEEIARLKEITTGGTIAKGAEGVGRMAQQVPVMLASQTDTIADLDLAAQDRLFVAASPTDGLSLTRNPADVASSSTAILYTPQRSVATEGLQEVKFRKVTHHPAYSYGRTEKVDLQAVKRNFFNEAVVSELASGNSYIFDVNSTTQKSAIYGDYLGGKNLEDLKTDLSLDCKQRIIILYLAFKQYQKKCLARNYLHRDLKEANFVAERNDTLLSVNPCDYGLAISYPDGHPLYLPDEKMLGTDRYMAPEIKRGHYSEKSEIYALGLMVVGFLNQSYFDPNKGGLPLSPSDRHVAEDLVDYANNSMRETEADDRPTLQAVLKVFEKRLRKHFKIDPVKAEQLGMLFEAQLPGTKQSATYKRGK